jgi:hypothetical protein
MGEFMSISTLTTLGAARDEGDPKKSDTGKAPEGSDAKARITDALVSSIPTEVVAAYTAAVTLVVGFIDPAKGKHFPDQFKVLRWWMFAALILVTAVSIYFSFRAKSQKRQPLAEVVAGVLAAAIWGLSLPESPLAPTLHGDNKAIAPALIIFGGGTLLVAVSSMLAKKSTKAQ